MKEERLKILEMLQEGKITAEDAVKLLEALGDTEEESEENHKIRINSDGGDVNVHDPTHVHAVASFILTLTILAMSFRTFRMKCKNVFGKHVKHCVRLCRV